MASPNRGRSRLTDYGPKYGLHYNDVGLIFLPFFSSPITSAPRCSLFPYRTVITASLSLPGSLLHPACLSVFLLCRCRCDHNFVFKTLVAFLFLKNKILTCSSLGLFPNPHLPTPPHSKLCEGQDQLCLICL